MSLYSYRVLQMVVQQKSFTKAATLLNLSPSAVSHAIAKLEEEFGFPLFIRSRKNVSLNENGLQVYRYVQDILNSSDMLERRVSQIKGSSVGTVRLGVIDSVAVNWLPGILARFHEDFPAIEIKVKENIYMKLLEDVQTHELDIAVVSHSAMQSMKTALQFIPVYEDRIVCVSPKGYAPENGEFVPADELAHMKIILPEAGNGADIEEWMQAQGIKLKPCCTAITNTSLAAMVRCGMGHAIVTALTLQGIRHIEDMAIYPVVPMGFRMLGVATYPQKFLTPVTRQMLSCIVEYAEGYREDMMK